MATHTAPGRVSRVPHQLRRPDTRSVPAVRPRTLTSIAATGTVVVLVAMASLWLRGRSLEVQYSLYVFHNGPPAVMLFWLGRLVVLRQSGNRVGWVLEAIAVLGVVHVLIASWADLAIVAWGYTDPIALDHDLVPAEMPLSASIPLFLMNWLWVPQPVLLVGVLPLIFPDGRLPGPPWRVGLWLAGIAGVFLIAATAIDGWPTSTWTVAEGPPDVVNVLFAVGGLTMLTAAVIAFAGLGQRWRRAPASRRRPFHVVGVAVAVLALVAIAAYPWQWLWIPAVLIATYGVLAAYALAAARFRLHDLEPVLGKSVVADGLALVVAAGYLGLVVGAGLLATRWTDDAVAPLVAVGVVALLAEPVRRGARRVIDRLVFRLAADSTDVVSHVAEHATHAAGAGEMLNEVVQLLTRSTGAPRAEAWLADTDGLRLATADGPEIAGDAVAAPVIHQGRTLGELRLLSRASVDLAPGSARVLTDVANVVGTALHNNNLSEQLQAQLEELRSSRRRLVEAQETARRDLERDLHDGAQAQLVSLRLRLGAIQASESTGAGELAALADEIDSAIGSLRDLARGLHPPMLDQSGLVSALRAHVRTLAVPVHVHANGVPRLDPAVEAAVYFSCLEAVQNALRHSGTEAIDVELSVTDDQLRFTVRDSGRGFVPGAAGPGRGLTNISDRLAALGGHVRVESDPGAGTRVHGAVPR